ncbi:hypothetical protein AMTR_s00045p00063740 [Amborella trichopoda]|uniref:Fibronectin type III-like domain-containing protein n=1 Tax=Amborella trichopoda TaxID=13333 RepID=W1P224_AMBTC|nr:hypothetical protein AMTR_s00045p00063740 [Amborella trichopoda]
MVQGRLLRPVPHDLNATEAHRQPSLPRKNLQPVEPTTRNSTPSASVLATDSSCKEVLEFEVMVQHWGKTDGSHVVLVYSVPPKRLEGEPIKQLVGFQRVYILAGGNDTLKFELNGCESFSLVEKTTY